MSKYIVETFYTCSFKIVHKLDELNEKKLSELENRNDGKFEIIDVKLNNRKTKTFNPNLDKGESGKNSNLLVIFVLKKCINMIYSKYILSLINYLQFLIVWTLKI